jgi:hypothetical protein
MVLLCVLLSFFYDQDLVTTTLCLVAVTYTYDELGAAGNIVGKALCTAGGYASFEVGATTIISMCLIKAYVASRNADILH